jgi:hypothetical protein
VLRRPGLRLLRLRHVQRPRLEAGVAEEVAVARQRLRHPAYSDR